MLSPTDGWALGSTAFHWNGSQWQEKPGLIDQFNAFDFIAPDDGWAVVSGDAMAHWNGSSWEMVATNQLPLISFESVKLLSATNGWAVAQDSVIAHWDGCLLYTSDAADERSSVDLGGRRIIKKKKTNEERKPSYI